MHTAEEAAAKIGAGELTGGLPRADAAVRKMGLIGNLPGMLPGGSDEGRVGRGRRQTTDRVQAIIRGVTPQETADLKIVKCLAAAAHRQRPGRHGVRGQPEGSSFFEARKMMSSMLGGAWAYRA